ncbi:hypothetical protein WG29040_23340 [Pseudomonas sp. PAMC 29040]|uniref:hypothetical protein n=1 Tax=Pseudomonas sp. PAMC 29040 TaxID=2498450 RepID=UPI000FC010D0|nr:hypothetical protein [Pseudomonas sp. PAMC 29040]RUT30876.1 hypothetical protein WG29040_23340 [Pseudomonas sp. PAMC 29040]
MPILPLMFSRMSADLLAHRMRFLACPEILADLYDINPPADFDLERWADTARALTEDLHSGKAITPSPATIALLVESLEGNSVIGKAPISARAGLVQVAAMIAKRLEPYAGRSIHPEVH